METGKVSQKEEEVENILGTKEMGPPAAPEAHPLNSAAAVGWGPKRGSPLEEEGLQQQQQPSYVLPPDNVPVDRQHRRSGQSPLEHILNAFNSWTRNAESLASNVWENLKTAPSKSEAAWGKLSLTAKAISEGGFESLYKQTFPTDPSERLKKTFACYLSTTTGPVAGTLYLSTHKLAFCSDRPLSFTAPSGQEAWSYYKVVIPLAKVASVNPVTMKEKEKYVQVVTVDGHEFWYMGFVNYDKAVSHLLDAVSDYAAARMRAPEVPEPAVVQ